jgi:hypothetical protein
MNFLGVTTNVITVFFASMAYRVLGITSAGDRANIFEDGYKYRNQDPSSVVIPAN